MTAPSLEVRAEGYERLSSESQTPTPIIQRFFLGEHVIEVVDVQDQWPAPTHRYFKVRGDDGNIYILRYDTGSDRWHLVFYDRTTDAVKNGANDK